MLRSLRKLIAKIIMSNRLTRGLMVRLALDESIFPEILKSEIVQYRMDDEAEVRAVIRTLAAESRLVQSSSSSVKTDDLYVEPGLNALHEILSHPRSLDVLASDRVLLRKVLRNSREINGIADEVAQYGPLLSEVLKSSTGRTALKQYIDSRPDSDEAQLVAQQLTNILLDNRAIHLAVQSDNDVSDSLKLLVGEK